MKFAQYLGCTVSDLRRAPQGARGLKSVKIIYSDGAEMVAPRKGRVG